ncbi:MAG: D-alanyl-D-alanine carboxypeptidase [Oscillospiraceae bacterium]|nr:D-alanyl-D-alanine carboxypeptidase [Oscillospiraceae bacterium]
MLKKLLPMLLVLVTIFTLVPFTTAGAITYDIDFDTKTEALELINLDTDSVVYAKNADKKMYPASTTKIMTYIVVAESVKDLEGTKITVKKSVLDDLHNTGSSLAGIYEGEELTVLQLLNLMMVPSGNDAAAVLCDYVSNGDEKKFVEKMNQKATELGCTGTHFANAHGLHDPDHYTTADDLYKITKYAMTLPYFTEITAQSAYTLPPTNKSKEERTVVTTNRMLISGDTEYYYQYAQGIKTGHTDEAGYCLVSSAIYDGSNYLCVALGAPSLDKDGKAIEERQDMIDSANLYRWAFTKLQLKPIAEKGNPVSELPLKYVWGKETILVSPEENLSAVLPADVNTSSLLVDVDVPESVSAPLHAGDVIGTATYSYAGQVLGSVNVVVTEDVARNEVLHVMDVIWSVISSPIFLICAALVILLVIVYITMAVRYNKKKKELRKTKNYKGPRH